MRGRLRKTVRSQMLRQRQQLDDEFINRHSHQIYKRLKRTQSYRESKIIAIYYAMGGEVNLNNMIEATPFHGKQICLPVTCPQQNVLEFYGVNGRSKLERKEFGIYQPNTLESPKVDVNDIDLMIVPIVSFDERCNRIGMGKGYYDKTLAMHRKTMKARVIGVAYDLQYCSFIVPERWDIPLDAVITEKTVYVR